MGACGNALTGGRIATTGAAIGAGQFDLASSEAITARSLRGIADASIRAARRSRCPESAGPVAIAETVLLAGAFGIRSAVVFGVRAVREVSALAVVAVSFELCRAGTTKSGARAVATNAIDTEAGRTSARRTAIRASFDLARGIAAVTCCHVVVVARFVALEQTITTHAEPEMHPAPVTTRWRVDPTRCYGWSALGRTVAKPPT